MVKESELISVVIPNYNHGHVIANAINSILSQSYQNIEIVCVDDCSTDDSRSVINAFIQQDSRVKAHFLEKNVGVMSAVNHGWEQISGKFAFAFAADDQFVSLNFFSDAINALKNYPEASGFFGKTQFVDSKSGRIIGVMGMSNKSGYISPNDFIKGFLRGKLFIPGSSAIWRKDFVDNVGGYPKDLGSWLDFYINHILPSMYGVIYSDNIYTSYTLWVDGSNFSKTGSLFEKLKKMVLFEKKLRSNSSLFNEYELLWIRWRLRKFAEFLFSHIKVFIFKR